MFNKILSAFICVLDFEETRVWNRQLQPARKEQIHRTITGASRVNFAEAWGTNEIVDYEETGAKHDEKTL